MTDIKKTFSDKYKAKIALEALKEQKTTQEISSTFNISSRQVLRLKKFAKENFHTLFSKQNNKSNKEKEQKELTDMLYKEIGKLKIECEWLKKKIGED